jgi:hypothetical protein
MKKGIRDAFFMQTRALPRTDDCRCVRTSCAPCRFFGQGHATPAAMPGEAEGCPRAEARQWGRRALSRRRGRAFYEAASESLALQISQWWAPAGIIERRYEGCGPLLSPEAAWLPFILPHLRHLDDATAVSIPTDSREPTAGKTRDLLTETTTRKSVPRADAPICFRFRRSALDAPNWWRNGGAMLTNAKSLKYR